MNHKQSANTDGIKLLHDKVALENLLQHHRWTDEQLAMLDSEGLVVEAYLLSPTLQLEFRSQGCFMAYVESLKKKR